MTLVRTLPPGAAVFRLSGLRPASALANLRNLLSQMEIPEAKRYRSHDFRRGHTQDLMEGGSPCAEILRAGQWCPLKSYLDWAKVEDKAVHYTHGISSSDEDDDVLSDVDM